jgi:Family of unknown function (DUF6194)
MSPETLPTGPDPEAITRYILKTYPDADIVTIEGGSFFSLDPEAHWPIFATVIWSDDFDQVSDLARPGVFRLNLGVERATFDRLVGSTADPDHSALDVLLPHPEYARQHWISILNPSDETYRDVVLPLLAEAYDKLAAQRARHEASPGEPTETQAEA